MLIPATIADYVTLLESGEPFTHTNVGGDGELLTITGWGGVNSDGRKSTPEKAAALATVILEPRATYHGYNPGKEGSDKLANAVMWLREHGVNVPIKTASTLEDPEYGHSRVNVRWVHKEIISSSNVRGRLGPFLKALQARPLYIIGSTDITAEFVTKLGAVGSYLLAPDVGWARLDEIEARIRTDLSSLPADTTVTWSLGYLTKVLQWRITPDYPALTQLDVGACWDAYCGVHHRHGYRKPEWRDAMRANLAALA